MNKVIQLFLVMAIFTLNKPLFGQNNAPNAIDKYFKQYVDDERFSVVYISPKLFEIIGRFDIGEMEIDDEEGKAFMEVIKDTKGLRILSTDVTPRKFYEEAKQKINTSEYEVLMTVRDNKDKEDVEFLVRENGNVIQELFLLVGGDEDFVMMSFIGNIKLKSISNLADSIDKN